VLCDGGEKNCPPSEDSFLLGSNNRLVGNKNIFAQGNRFGVSTFQKAVPRKKLALHGSSDRNVRNFSWKYRGAKKHQRRREIDPEKLLIQPENARASVAESPCLEWKRVGGANIKFPGPDVSRPKA